MRDIKFRAWNGRKMYYMNSKTPDGNEVEFTFFSDGIKWGVYDRGLGNRVCSGEYDKLMRFTGLKDRKGKEIYEGDIIRTWYSRDMSGKDIITIVEAVEFDASNEKAGFEIPFLHTAEVIGNIYETPKLLNVEQEVQGSDTTEAK